MKPTHVYRLVATFVCPYTGMEGHPDRQIHSTTVFATRELAESRYQAFRRALCDRLKVAPDYEMRIEAVEMEVIYE